MSASIPDAWQWFPQARYGMFIHWGPYANYGRGEQVLFREHLNQAEYARNACAWKPSSFDAKKWAQTAKEGGMKYAVMTTRHHDGFCMWDSKLTDYTSARQAAGQDYIKAYTTAFREAGLRVGLYYSLADWRIPAYWNGPKKDPQGFDTFRAYVHGQVKELISNYGKIDVIWFDGAWPHSANTWHSEELVKVIRSLQPGILINNRLGTLESEAHGGPAVDGGVGTGESRKLGDFGTPEHHITADPNRLWESCQVSTWRLWCYTRGERWRPADYLLDMLVEAASKGGNLLMNMGPDEEGHIPPEFSERSKAIGDWLKVHGEAIYGTDIGDVSEFITYGRQTRKGNDLYLVIRFWDGRETLTLGGLDTRVKKATLITTGQELQLSQTEDHLTLKGLPAKSPTPFFPVIKLECAEIPKPRAWAKDRLWCGDASRMAAWAQARGTSVMADGR